MNGINWATGVEGAALVLVAVVIFPLGALAGWSWAKELTPLIGQERRDTAIGWSVVGALVAVIALAALVSALADLAAA